jgi:hypothetical protein
MNGNCVRIWKEAIVACWKYYPGIRLERVEKTTNNLAQDSQRVNVTGTSAYVAIFTLVL